MMANVAYVLRSFGYIRCFHCRGSSQLVFVLLDGRQVCGPCHAGWKP